MAVAPRALGKTLAPQPRVRAAIAKRIATHASQITTATVTAMEDRHPWFADLDPDNRSWIMLVARHGIDGFIAWFADPEEPESASTRAVVFGKAPP